VNRSLNRSVNRSLNHSLNGHGTGTEEAVKAAADLSVDVPPTSGHVGNFGHQLRNGTPAVRHLPRWS
jgi:hypothetical protein